MILDGLKNDKINSHYSYFISTLKLKMFSPLYNYFSIKNLVTLLSNNIFSELTQYNLE